MLAALNVCIKQNRCNSPLLHLCMYIYPAICIYIHTCDIWHTAAHTYIHVHTHVYWFIAKDVWYMQISCMHVVIIDMSKWNTVWVHSYVCMHAYMRVSLSVCACAWTWLCSKFIWACVLPKKYLIHVYGQALTGTHIHVPTDVHVYSDTHTAYTY